MFNILFIFNCIYSLFFAHRVLCTVTDELAELFGAENVSLVGAVEILQVNGVLGDALGVERMVTNAADLFYIFDLHDQSVLKEQVTRGYNIVADRQS